MKNISKSTYIKIIAFGLLKKLVLIYILFYGAAHASGTYSGIYFDDYEEKATLYLCNYYSYSYLNDVINNSTTSRNLINGRIETLYSTVSDIDDISGVGSKTLHYLKQESHLIDWNTYTDEFGMTLHQTNFMYALVGTLIGFTFLFFFIYIVIGVM